MKYAEAPITEAEIHIAAAPDEVWPFVTDIETPVRFSAELYEVEWLGRVRRPVPGATFLGRNRNAALGAWQTVSRISEVVPHQVFSWCVADLQGEFEPPAAVWSFRLVEDEGGTLLRQSARIGPGSSGVSLAIAARPELEERIVDGRILTLNRAMQGTLNGIKGLAESW